MAIFTGAKGVNVVMTSACASALHAIGYAYTEIVMGRADAVITGGMESTITPMGISGFTSMKALCTKFNDEPHKASRPFDRDRAGFVMGEGAGMLLLESLDCALDRGARIYAEVGGFGASDDAYHIVAPLESGDGMAASMRRALEDAQAAPEEVDHISAHGTSTQANDVGETRAIHAVFGAHAGNIAITAVKSQIGHLLGASGGVAGYFRRQGAQDRHSARYHQPGHAGPGMRSQLHGGRPSGTASALRFDQFFRIRRHQRQLVVAALRRLNPPCPRRPVRFFVLANQENVMQELMLQDPQVAEAIWKESRRQVTKLELIASENFVSGRRARSSGIGAHPQICRRIPGQALLRRLRICGCCGKSGSRPSHAIV